jgi:hypothetical protein
MRCWSCRCLPSPPASSGTRDAGITTCC